MDASTKAWLLWLLISIAAPAYAATGDAGAQPSTLRAIDHGILPGERIVIRATFDEPLERAPSVFRTYHPRVSIALDFPSTASAIRDDAVSIAFRGVRGIDIVQAGHLTRLVVHLDEPRIGELAVKGRELWLTLTPFEIPRPERETWFSRPSP